MNLQISLASLRIHLAHCAYAPGVGRALGVAFTTTGTPIVVAVPTRH